MTTETCRRVTPVIKILLVVIVVFLLIQSIHKAHRDIGNDFTSYLLSAEALKSGIDPYKTETVFPYIYPLFLAFLLVPLTLLPYGIAVTLWYLLNVFSLAKLIMFPALDRSHAVGSNRCIIWMTAGAVALTMFSFIQNHLLNGQVNLIVVAGTAFGTLAILRSHIWLGTIVLSGAIALKMVPILLVMFLLVERKFLETLLVALFVTFYCLIPIVLTGPELFVYYSDYWNTVIVGGLASKQVANESIMYFTSFGLIERFMPSLSGSKFVHTGAVLMTLLPIVAIHERLRRTGKGGELVKILIYFPGILLITPTSQTHHLVWTIPCFSYLLTYLALHGVSKCRIVMVLTCLSLAFLNIGQFFKESPFHVISLISLVVALYYVADNQETNIVWMDSVRQ